MIQRRTFAKDHDVYTDPASLLKATLHGKNDPEMLARRTAMRAGKIGSLSAIGAKLQPRKPSLPMPQSFTGMPEGY